MNLKPMHKRFDGYLPIVIDTETSGLNPLTNALLEIAAINIKLDNGIFTPGEDFVCHVLPFEGAKIDEAALQINKIDPYHPFRFAIDEHKALEKLFEFSSKMLQEQKCRRAVLVGHNAHFDLSFIQAAMKRCKIKKSPFHAFTCFDTATLAGLAYGKTILAKALTTANIDFDKDKAHSAIYDAQKTAELFCDILNRIRFKTPEEPASGTFF
ncbi:MAG: ribonuclease T [Coxiella sp. RIFCSPHIGHO2_12_FULL_42_15]|nr:MAG: ribonuclease T [Coxiella sp. RIFCSPHIGHO2_12_FULL_42_15]